jgi:hypothetical protein
MCGDVQSPTGQQKPEIKGRRPFFVTLLTVMVLIIASTHLVRFIEALSEWDFLSSLPRVSPAYLAASGLLWTLVGLPLIWGLWRGHAQAPKAIRILAPAYTSYYWLDRILVKSVVGSPANWPFALGLTIILLVLIFWVLSTSKSRSFFGEIDD